MTLTLELPEELQRRLEEMAQQQHKSPEDFAAALLREKLQTPHDTVSDEEFQAVAQRVIARDRELLERLAK